MAKKVPIAAKEVIENLGRRSPRSLSLPHLSELAEAFIDLAGGPKKFAKMLFMEWQSAPEGSIARMRILETMTRVWKSSEDPNTKLDDLGILSDDDIEREITSRLQDLLPEEEAHDEVQGHPGPEAGTQNGLQGTDEDRPAADPAGAAAGTSPGP